MSFIIKIATILSASFLTGFVIFVLSQPPKPSSSHVKKEFFTQQGYPIQTKKDSLLIEIDSIKKIINNYLSILKNKKAEVKTIKKEQPKKWIFFRASAEPVVNIELDSLDIDSVHISLPIKPKHKTNFIKRLFHKKKH